MSKKEAIEKLLEKVSANLWDYTSPNVAITNKYIADSKKLIDQAIALSKPEPLRNQPCGCILCDCDSEGRCLGCGSKMCGKHQEIGHLPKNEMAYHKAEQPPASEFTKECREVVIEGRCGKDIKEAVEPEVMVEVDNDGNITPVKQVQKPKRGKQGVTDEGKQETEKCHPDECICDECKTRQVNDQRLKNKLEYYETKGVICSGLVVTVKPKRGKDIKHFTDLSSASEFTKEIREYLSLVCKRTSEDTSWEQLEDIITEITKKLYKACKIIDALEASHEDYEKLQAENESMKEFIEETANAEAYREYCNRNKKVEEFVRRL